MTRNLVVCADDYAQTPEISAAIVDLAERGRISAISCMTTSPLWPEHAKRLLPLRGRVDIGVHLVLIEDSPLTKMSHMAPSGRLPSLATLLRDSVSSPRFPRDEIAAEIAAQCDGFVAAMGSAPSHLDGHRHTHVFPRLRRLVIDAAARLTPRPYLRNIAEPAPRVFARGVAVPKALFLSLLGGGFASAAQQAGVRANDGFSGVYSLSPGEDYPALFERFIAGAGSKHLVMCHPGGTDDPVLGATRAQEYAFLASDAYPALLAKHGFSVGRLAS